MTGRPPYKPTDEQRRMVRAMAGYGMPQIDIGTFLDIDAKTLRKHFTRELELGSIEATTKVAQSLFRMATEGKNVAAAIFWMKARAGWREKQVLPPDEDVDPNELTDEELTRIARGGQGDGALVMLNGQPRSIPARLRPVLAQVQPEELNDLISELRARIRMRKEGTTVIAGRTVDVPD